MLSEETNQREVHGPTPASRPLASHRSRRSMTSISPSSVRSSVRRSPTSPSWISSPRPTTSFPRPAGDGQDPPVDRTGGPGVPARSPGRLRHRTRVGQMPRRCAARRAARGRARVAPTSSAPDRRRGRLHHLDPEAAVLFFALISSRYERRSLVLSSNKTLSTWAEIFGDPVAVAAMVDRLVHHAEVIVTAGTQS